MTDKITLTEERLTWLLEMANVGGFCMANNCRMEHWEEIMDFIKKSK